MAEYHIINAEELEAELRIIADAIRKKKASGERIRFPGGFAPAIMEISGSPGEYGTLPPQIKQFRAQAGDARVQLFWSNPQDPSFSGVYLVRKEGSMPQGPSDGTRLDAKQAVSYTDAPLRNGITYHYRAFPYNAQGGLQTVLTGAAVQAVPKRESQPLGRLSVGDVVRVAVPQAHQERLGRFLYWQLAEKGREGYPRGSVTLLAQSILMLAGWDAAEPSNPNESRARFGSNRYRDSNVSQWLNSTAQAGSWYRPAHTHDAPPRSSGMQGGHNAYEGWPGFLAMLEPGFVRRLMDTEITTVIPDCDFTDDLPDYYDTLSVKMFLPSDAELGAPGSIDEGGPFALFAGSPSLTAKPTPQAVQASSYQHAALSPQRGWDWWVRTATDVQDALVQSIDRDGRLQSSLAHSGSIGIRPVCCLPQEMEVALHPNEDGSYELLL